MLRILLFIVLVCVIFADEGDYYASNDPDPTFLPTEGPTNLSELFPTEAPTNLTELFPTEPEPPLANGTETSSSSKGDWSYRDQIAMAAIVLLSIPAIVGFTLSLSLIDRSIMRSQRLPTTSPSAHSSNHEEGDEVIEWELQATNLKEPPKYSDKALQKTTKTFQEWFTTSSSPNSKKKQGKDFSYSLQPNADKADPPFPEASIDNTLPKETDTLFQKFTNYFSWTSAAPKTPPKSNPQSFVINIFKEDDPFLELTVATPLDEQEDQEFSFHQYLHHQALYHDDNTRYTLRI